MDEAEQISLSEYSDLMAEIALFKSSGIFAHEAVEAMEQLSQAINDVPLQEEEGYKEPPHFHICRICGRRYTHKSEAKACAREHRRGW